MTFVSDPVRPKGQEHIPKYTKGFVVLRIFQFIVGLVVLGLAGYSVALVPFVGNCLSLFTAIVSVIATLWMIIAHTCAKNVYNYWAVLVFDIFLFLFWFISFCLLAVQTTWYFGTSTFYIYSDYYDSDYDSYYDDYYGFDDYGLSDAAVTFGAILAAVAGLGALNCLFFFISMIIHSIVVHRHRRSGLHSKPVKNGQQPVYNMTPQYAPVAQTGANHPQFSQQTAYAPYGSPAQGYSQQVYDPQQGGYYNAAAGAKSPQSHPPQQV